MSTTESKGKIIRRTITDPITNLRAHVEFLNKPTPRAAEINGFDVEFNYVEKTSRQTEVTIESKTANLAENNDKNRYMNVKPPDFSRVKLTPIAGVPGSDYVNANFITGHGNRPKIYISAQGPLENTAHDFWRMVWEHKLYVVVMLTKEVENDKIKCSRYWPLESQTLTYGSLQITLEQMTAQKDLITRKMKFENIDSKESRQIVHFQYTGWLDHGVPPSTKSFLNLLQAVDSTNGCAPKDASDSSSPPILIHCSAGIGRSGTFCAIHINWHLMKDHFETNEKPPPLNIVNTILNLRKERPGMVQTKEQFIFVYAVVLEEYRRMQKEAKKRLKKSENGESGNAGAEVTTATTTATTTTTATATATTTTSESASQSPSPTPSLQSN